MAAPPAISILNRPGASSPNARAGLRRSQVTVSATSTADPGTNECDDWKSLSASKTAGGRTLDGPYAGVGSANPGKSHFVRGFRMTESERADMLAFLESLTDTDFLENPATSDPFR